MAFEVFNFGKRLGIVGPGAEAASQSGGDRPITVSGKTVYEWPDGGCWDGMPVVTDKIYVESSPLDPGYTKYVIDCIPSSGRDGGNGVEGPVTYGKAPESDKERYPLTIEDFKEKTHAPPTRDEVSQMIEDCDELSKNSILDAYEKLFNKDASILKNYPPFVYNCLLDAFKNLTKIKCHPERGAGGSDAQRDGSVLHIGDLTAIMNPYTVLWSILSNMLAQSKGCIGLSGWLGVFAFEKPANDKKNSDLIKQWCEAHKGEFDRKRRPIWHSNPLKILIVDIRDGKVYSNPFYPASPPQNWRPTAEDVPLYMDSRLMCKI